MSTTRLSYKKKMIELDFESLCNFRTIYILCYIYKIHIYNLWWWVTHVYFEFQHRWGGRMIMYEIIVGDRCNLVMVVVVVVLVREEVHLCCYLVMRWCRRGMVVSGTANKVDLEGDGGGGGGACGWRRGCLGANCGFHVVVVVGTKFPLGVVDVFRERVENSWLVEKEAPNWIWIHGESTPSSHKISRERSVWNLYKLCNGLGNKRG